LSNFYAPKPLTTTTAAATAALAAFFTATSWIDLEGPHDYHLLSKIDNRL
jgi:hypothetical protein